MAVEDPQQPPQQQPSQTVQRLIKAAAAGQAAQTAVGAAAAPAVAVTLPAQAAVGTVKVPAELFVNGVKVAIILRVLRRLLARHHAESADWLTKELRKQFPNADPLWISQAVQKELAYEQAFQQKAMKRTEASLQQAGALKTPEAQAKRVNEVIDREKHYAGLREKAMLNRAKGHVQNQSVKAVSPDGAKWVLGQRKNHTLGCLALAGKNWPWEVLDMIPPPLHAQCGCELVPLKPGETVLPVGQAIPMAKAAMALEEAIRRSVGRAEIDVYLAERAYQERLEEVKWQDWLHPRGRGGKWIDKFGPGGHLPGLEPEHEKAGEPKEPKKPYVPKPTWMPELSPGSTVVSGPPPEGEAYIGGNVPEPAKQAAIPNFSHVPLKLQLPPAFGADHFKAKGADENYIVKDHGGDRSRVASELLANGIYRELGVDVPTMGHVQMHAVPDWSKRAEDLPTEPPVDAPKGTRISVGVVLRDKDGRVTLIEPRNHYGGTIHGFPKGGQEPNLTLQQGAHKELWEESGLTGHITDVIGDFKGDTGVTRYYLGVRTGGEATPSDETVAVKTVTPDEAKQMLNKQRDQDVLKAVLEKPIPEGEFEDQTPPEEPGSALAFTGVPGKTRDITDPNEALGKGYMADALVANRDFLGQRGANVRWKDDETPIRTNMASTFGYGAGDQHDFGNTPEEIWTMRYRGQAAGTIAAGEEQLRQQAADIARILTNAKIDQLTKAAGFPDPKERTKVAKALKARVAWMKKFASGEESLPQPMSGGEARAAFEDAQSGFEIYPEEHQALDDYAGAAGRGLDGHLRSGKDFTDPERKLAKTLDGLLDATSAPGDSYVYIGSPGEPNKGMVGKTFSMASYTQAHTERAQAKGAGHVRLLVPGGARALHLTDAEEGQPDMLLPRDQRMQITGLRTGPDGKPTLEGMVLPYRRPRSLPSAYKPPSGGGYKSPMSQTQIKGLGSSKPKGEFFAKGDRVDVNGNKATVTGDAGKGMANVKLDSGKGYTVPFSILKRLEESVNQPQLRWVRDHDGRLSRVLGEAVKGDQGGPQLHEAGVNSRVGLVLLGEPDADCLAPDRVVGGLLGAERVSVEDADQGGAVGPLADVPASAGVAPVGGRDDPDGAKAGLGTNRVEDGPVVNPQSNGEAAAEAGRSSARLDEEGSLTVGKSGEPVSKGVIHAPDDSSQRELGEGVFKEFLHPRGRGGKWVEGAHDLKLGDVVGPKSGTGSTHHITGDLGEKWRLTSEDDGHVWEAKKADMNVNVIGHREVYTPALAEPEAPKGPAPPVSESIARLEALGLDVKPPKANISKLSDQEVADIADAFEDSFKQYPILQHGPGRHVGVVEFCSNVKVKKLKGGVLADTAAGLYGGGTSEKALTPRTRIRINDLTPHHMKPGGPPQPGAATGGQLCPASQSWKGCMYHELGHAMMEAIDMAGHHDPKRYVDWMSRYGVTFKDCNQVSTYAVASRSEGIAELAAMANTPGFMPLLQPDMQAKVGKMFSDLKNWDLDKPYAYEKPLPGATGHVEKPLPKIKATAPKVAPKPKAAFQMPSKAKLSGIEAQVKAHPGTAGEKKPVSELGLAPGDVFEGHTPGLRYLVISDPSEKSGLRYVPLNQGKGDAYRFSGTSKRRKVDLHFDLSEADVTLDVSPETMAKVDEVAAKNRAAGDWVEPDPLLDENDPAEPLDEAVYTEALHPRGRGGKWIGKPGGKIRRAVEAEDTSPVGKIVGSLGGKTGDEGYQALASGEALDTQRLNQVDGKYTAARKLLHQSIINHFFEHAEPAEGKPKAIFTAGGAASGKSGLAGQARDAESNLDIPKGAVYINPDDIKEMIPEYAELKKRGREDVAAAATHEESSDLAKLMTAIAMDGHYPVIVDGTGDSKVGKFGDKLRAAQKAGYDVEARYAHVPVSEAISRERKRAERTGRKVATSLLREQHKTVAQSYTSDVVKEPGVHVKVYSTVERGKPKLIAEKPAGGALTVSDQKQYDQHLSKAKGL